MSVRGTSAGTMSVDRDAGTSVCLAFASTLLGDGDELGTPSGLRAWLAHWAGQEDADRDEVVLRLGDFRALRDAVHDALAGAVEPGRAPAEAVRELNAASAAVPTWPALDEGGLVRRTEAAAASVTARILAEIARSAIELLGGPDRSRVRACASCGRFFLAARPGQVWCSAGCGNRARVARHRARRVGAPPSAPG